MRPRFTLGAPSPYLYILAPRSVQFGAGLVWPGQALLTVTHPAPACQTLEQKPSFFTDTLQRMSRQSRRSVYPPARHDKPWPLTRLGLWPPWQELLQVSLGPAYDKTDRQTVHARVLLRSTSHLVRSSKCESSSARGCASSILTSAPKNAHCRRLLSIRQSRSEKTDSSHSTSWWYYHLSSSKIYPVYPIKEICDVEAVLRIAWVINSLWAMTLECELDELIKHSTPGKPQCHPSSCTWQRLEALLIDYLFLSTNPKIYLSPLHSHALCLNFKSSPRYVPRVVWSASPACQPVKRRCAPYAFSSRQPSRP